MKRVRNKPPSCRSHRTKVANKPRNVLRRIRIRSIGASVGIAAAAYFGGPIAALGVTMLEEMSRAAGALAGALLAEKLFLRR